MKKHQFQIFMAIILQVFLCMNARSQQARAFFSGTFNYHQKNIPDSICLSAMQDGNAWGILSYHYAKVERNTFKLSLPEIKKPTLFMFLQLTKGRRKVIDTYYAEPGDSIHMTFIETSDKDSILFCGPGSAKYKMATLLTKQYTNFGIQVKKLRYPVSLDSTVLNSYLKGMASLIKKWSELKSSSVKSCGGLSDEISKLLIYQYAPYYDEWTTMIDYLYRFGEKQGGSLRSRKQISKHFNEYNNLFSYHNLDSLSVLSPVQFIEMAFRLKTQLLIDSESLNADMVLYYDLLKQQSSGLIRQRLLTEFFISTLTMQQITNYNPDKFDSLVVDALNIVKIPYYKELISDKLKTRKGSKIYEAEFIDLKGHKFNIASLKGKVILIDIWSLGCGACVQFHSILEKDIYPALSSQPDFVVLSVNADKTKDRWLSGLNSNNYSSKEYINISTGNLGQNHPFFKYYTNVLPLILIVDKKGQVVTKVRGAEKPEDLVRIIKNTLQQNASK